MSIDEKLTEMERSLSMGGVLSPLEKRALIAEVRLLQKELVESCIDEHEAGIDCSLCDIRNDHAPDCLLRPDRKLGQS
jgi:hypothetical protein